MKQQTKKYLLLAVLFFMPVLALLFFLKAQYNFKPVDRFEYRLLELPKNDKDYTLEDKITIVAFLGNDILNNKNIFFNLNQKINKRFEVYKHLRLLVVTLDTNKKDIESVMAELQQTADANIEKWNILYLSEANYRNYYDRIGLIAKLDEKLNAEDVYLVDQELQIRGRKDDKDNGEMIGFNPNDVSEVNKLKDDVKMLLKEYSIHNNENKANRKKSNINLENEE
ncbi:MAG: hypothetical protein HRT68_01000 [Flavobacteriaceae bacterium]|nr:hypothetical protein [Flavobacteriaceae bacterium]